MAAEDENESGLVNVLQRASDLIDGSILDEPAEEEDAQQHETSASLPREYRQFLPPPPPVGMPGLGTGSAKSAGPLPSGIVSLPDPKQMPAVKAAANAKEGNLSADKVPSSGPSVNQRVSGKATKGKPKVTKRRTWKKPKDKPKRPLSAYNLFFQHERERIIAATAAPPENDDKNDEAGKGKPKRRRRHRKTHGKISFADLARNISTKWKELDGFSKAPFEARAATEQERYKKEIEIWKKKKAKEEAERELAIQEAEEKKCDAADNVERKIDTPVEMSAPAFGERCLSDEKRRRSTVKASNANVASAAPPAGQRRLSDEQRRRSTVKAGNANVASAAAEAAAALSGELEDDDEVFLSVIEDLESYEEQKTKRKPSLSYLRGSSRPPFTTRVPAPVQRVTSEDLKRLEPISISMPAASSDLEPFSDYQGVPQAQPEYVPSINTVIDHSTLIYLPNDRLKRIYDIVGGASSNANGAQSNRAVVDEHGAASAQQLQPPQFEISSVPLRGGGLDRQSRRDSTGCTRELLSSLKQSSELSMESCRSLLNNESMRDILQSMKNGTDVTHNSSSVQMEESMRNILEVMKAGPNTQKSSRTFKTDDESMAEMLLSFESLDSSLKDKFIGSMSTLDTTLTLSQPQTTTS